MTLEERFQSNVKLTIYSAKKFFFNTPVELHEDIISEARIGLWKACMKFDESKGIEFSTYAVNVINNQIRMFFRQLKKQSKLNTISLQETMSVDTDGSVLKLENILGYEPDYTDNVICSEIQKIMSKYPYLHMRVNSVTQREIARITGISQAHVSRMIKKERKKLSEELGVTA